QRNERRIEDRRSRIEDRGSGIERSLVRRSSILGPRSSILFVSFVSSWLIFIVSARRLLRSERFHKNIEIVAVSPQNQTTAPYLSVQVTQNGAEKTKLWT